MVQLQYQALPHPAFRNEHLRDLARTYAHIRRTQKSSEEISFAGTIGTGIDEAVVESESLRSSNEPGQGTPLHSISVTV